jgi:1-acyl-sn-glycerol-3-phosphate acyltransferase
MAIRPSSEADHALLERLRNFPGEPDMLVYGLRSIVALIIRALLRTYCRFEIIGEEYLRSNRSFVLVANHSSHLDTVCLLAGLPLRRLHRAFPAAAADYFFKSMPRTWIATVIVNALPFARQTHVRQSLTICGQLLSKAGNVLIIFPEGTRSRTGELQQFKPGLVRSWLVATSRSSLVIWTVLSVLAKGKSLAETAEGSPDYWGTTQLRSDYTRQGCEFRDRRRTS